MVWVEGGPSSGCRLPASFRSSRGGERGRESAQGTHHTREGPAALPEILPEDPSPRAITLGVRIAAHEFGQIFSPLQLAVWVMETENKVALIWNLSIAPAGFMQ